MTRAVKTAFRLEGVTVPLERILPTKTITPAIRASSRYQTVAASIPEVGVVEPLMVYPAKGAKGGYILLDGHVRLEVLKKTGAREAFCLVATDDEGYTYNDRVSHLAPIQQNSMLLRAMDAGVPEERLARALNVKPRTIRDSRNRLANICQEAVELLKDRQISEGALRTLKRVKPMRQIEMAELMVAANTYTTPYAHALFVATPKDQLTEEAAKAPEATRPQDLARMEKEMRSLERDFLLQQDSHGRNMMNLTLARGYLKRLLENGKVVRYLAQRHGDVLGHFQKILETASLDG